MFRKLKNKITEAASSVFGVEDPKVQQLVAMGFDAPSAANALEATNGSVDRAAELLLGSTPPPQNPPQETEEEILQRVMQESMQLEQQRRAPRTAAMNRAAQAAERRAAAADAKWGGSNKATNNRKKTATKPAPLRSDPASSSSSSRPITRTTQPNKIVTKSGLTAHHPQVKLIPKLQDKSKEEQILRCADRLKPYPQAVDTLHRALTTVQANPDNPKFRKIEKTTAGYQRTLATAPGAEDLLKAMNYRPSGSTTLLLDRPMVDAALLYLGVSALEQARLTPEYQEAKRKVDFAKTVRAIVADTSEASERAAFAAKCPAEPSEGSGTWMQVSVADEKLQRRFDGDDTLQDVLNWLGSRATCLPTKILSREWSLVDVNRYPVAPLDCAANQNHTLQYLGCWPSGRLEVLPSTNEWVRGTMVEVKPGSSRGLASAPAEVVYS